MGKSVVKISKPNTSLIGSIQLPPSKSVSNRALMIQQISIEPIGLANLSTSTDTLILQGILQQIKLAGNREDMHFDIKDAGTTMRFLTAYLSALPGVFTLNGSDRMHQRPIGPLVTALSTLGAKIEYLNQDGYPPIRIHGGTITLSETTLDGSISSQFISALLLISPLLPNGLVLRLTNKITSRPYIDMTLKLMAIHNVVGHWDGDTLIVSKQQYKQMNSEPYTIEADWSSASYWYTAAAIAEHTELQLLGLHPNNIQGDQIIKDLYTFFGLTTIIHPEGIQLTKNKTHISQLAFDFSDCPDIAQSSFVTAAGKNIQLIATGLGTLKIKETDRINSTLTELRRLGFKAESNQENVVEIKDKAGNPLDFSPIVQAYHDHRMVMSFAPLCLLGGTVQIENPEVVAKSYPNFWNDMRKLGFEVEGV